MAGFEQERSQCFMSPDEFSAGLKKVAEEKLVLDKKIEELEAKAKSAEKKLREFNSEEEEKKTARVFFADSNAR